jgi:hypothetical protein
MQAESRTHLAVVLAVTLLAALLAAGCGGQARDEPPALPADLAESLAGRADAVADRLSEGNPCAAAAEADELVRESGEAVEAGRVPPPLRDELLAGARDLAGRVECPAEAQPEEPPVEAAPDEPDEPAEVPEGEVQTLGLADAGEIEFRLLGDVLELVQVRPAPGWTHSVSADDDEIDVDLERGNREIAVAIDADGDGRLKLDVDYEAGRGGGEQSIRLGSAGEVVFEARGGTLLLLAAELAAGWQADVKEDGGDKIEIEARHGSGSEITLVIEPAD